MSLRLSQLGPKRRYERKQTKRRMEEGICVSCKDKLNHLNRWCDYCYLRNKISELRRELTRVEKLFVR